VASFEGCDLILDQTVRAPTSHDHVIDGSPPIPLAPFLQGMPRKQGDKRERHHGAALRCKRGSTTHETSGSSPVVTFPWIRERANQRAVFPLNFPNHSRSFDPSQRCVSFWGHAATIEVTFQVGGDVLQGMSPGATDDEASILGAFDSHRSVIETTARNVYDKSGQTFCRPYPADF
jgi:hypothetical protein